MGRKIGVLALQGDFAKHIAILEKLGVEAVQVKMPEQLNDCDGLIIPGGESTTLTKLMAKYGFYEPLREFARKFPVMGTCAGAILVAAEVDDPRVKPLQLMSISIHRNGYGRQLDSFITELKAPFLSKPSSFRTVFIRAPKILETNNGAKTLMSCEGKPVMVRENNVLAITFHPELTSDPRIHQYFLQIPPPLP